MRHKSVSDPRAVAEHDQHLAQLKEHIRRLSKEEHSIVLEKLGHFANASLMVREEMFGEVTVLAFMVASHAGITLMNEVALEKWGTNGTERDDGR